MNKLLQGVCRYQSLVFHSQREMFERLADGQKPEAMFITCSDSRIDPNLVTQTEPGELFILRNAGNLVPAHGAGGNGEEATIEFAVSVLGVKDIVICGHSHCGAMDALVHRRDLRDLPALGAWLTHADAARRIVAAMHPETDRGELAELAAGQNVLVQLANLRTHPAVAAELARGNLTLHGWIYHFETGEVLVYNESRGRFLPLSPRGAALPQPA